MEENLRNKTVSGMFWQFIQNISTQAVSFVVSVVLARLLLPEDYGVVGLAGMFLGLFGIFSSGGLAPAIIQKKDADDLDYNTMFVTQLCFSTFIYVILFFSAPLLAHLFHNEQLTLLVRVMAITMPLGSFVGVISSVISRRLLFRLFFYSGISCAIVSAIVGIGMAYSGCGVWALVGQQYAGLIVSTIVLSVLSDWHPRFQFSYTRFKGLFREGLKYMSTQLIGTATYQVKGYALGLKYSAADFAYYNRGEGLPNLLCQNIDNTIQNVLFPAIASVQDDKEAVRRSIRRSIRTSTYLLMPFLFGLAAISDKLVPLLYTDRWLPAIPFMQVLCFVLVVGVMCNVNLQALRATGHIGLILKLEFIKKPIMLLIILATMFISPLAIAWGMLFFNIFVYFINSYPNKKNIGYTYRQQLLDVFPNVLLSLTMAVVVYALGRLGMNNLLSVIVQVLVGMTLYVVASIIFKNESYHYVKDMVLEKFKRK